MITATVLFDRGIATRTFFGVGRDPVRGFGVVFAFLEPSFDEGA